MQFPNIYIPLYSLHCESFAFIASLGWNVQFFKESYAVSLNCSFWNLLKWQKFEFVNIEMKFPWLLPSAVSFKLSISVAKSMLLKKIESGNVFLSRVGKLQEKVKTGSWRFYEQNSIQNSQN